MCRVSLLLLVVMVACQRGRGAESSAQQPEQDMVTLAGAGSTFVQPLFWKWFSEYRKVQPNTVIYYESIGSGAGIKAVTEKKVDFGASDAPMTESELRAAPGIAHVPVTCGAVVPVFNLPGISTLRLTPDLLAAVFLGRITRWSDARLAAENDGTKLPDLDITVAHRADGSGTTAIFTDYLSKVSPDWRTGPCSGKSVNWPVGTGGRGNEFVTTLVQSTEGAIGYVELAYAIASKLSTASLRNRDGEFVQPTLQGVSAAAEQAIVPDDFRVSITDAPGKQTWPISGFSWILVPQDQPDTAKGAALLRLLWWAIHEGQHSGTNLGYAPLPLPLVRRIEERLKTMKVQGRATLVNVH